MSDPVIIVNVHEILMGAHAGMIRHTSHWKNHLKEDSQSEKTWDQDIESSISEVVVAKYLKIFWNGSFNTFKAPDLPGQIQVKWTPYDTGHLILRPQDKPDPKHRFWLVTGKCPVYTIRGWLFGDEVMIDKYWDPAPAKGCPAWFVPQPDLKPATVLIEEPF